MKNILLFSKKETTISYGDNIIPSSDNFSTWTNDGFTLTPNAITSPDDLLNASLIQNNLGYSSYCRLRFIKDIEVGKTYASFFYMKKGTANYGFIRNLDPTVVTSIFNLNTGVVVSTDDEASIEDVGNGWYLCSQRTVLDTLWSHVYVGSSNGVDATSNNGDSIYIYKGELKEVL